MARDMFSTEGYPGTSIRDIAVSVGIRGASMYNHFESKEHILWDLTLAALNDLAAAWEAVDAATAQDEPIERLAAFVRMHVRYHAEHHRDARIVNAELVRLAPEHFERATSMRADYEDALTTLLETAVADGAGDVPDVTITTYAILQMGMAVAGWYRSDGRLSVDELCEIYAVLAVKLVRPRGSQG